MSSRKLVAIGAAALVLVLAPAIAVVQSKPSTAAAGPVTTAPPAGAGDYEYMAELSDGIGPRVAGKAGEARAATRITEWFNALGYAPAAQPFTYKDAGASHTSQNVVATKPGASAEQIIIGAHYDSVGVGRGAFDNASGVALMMELAGELRARTTPYTLVFVAFGAEEPGLKGSAAYFRSLSTHDKAATVLMVNFDSVATGDQMYCYSSKDQAWPQLALRSMARQMGATILTSPGLNKDYPYGTTGDWSDHAVFARNHIPYLYFEATNWLIGDKDGYVNSARYGEIWHSRKDTISYIEQRFPGRIQAQLQTEYEALAEFLTTYSLN